MDLHDLRQSVELALEMVDAEATVIAAEVCASWCERQTVRVRYDADHPTDGVQMPQSLTTFGIGILVVIEDQDGRRVGFGSDCGDLSQEGVTLALEKAKANAVADPDFTALPAPSTAPSSSPVLYDPQVMTLPGDELARLATEAFNGALSTFREAGYVKALRVEGDVHSRKEHLVVGNTNGLLACETSTGLLAIMHGRLTGEQSQGIGTSSATHVRDFAAYDAGVEAAQQALRTRRGGTLAVGEYPVVFGPRAVADLLQDLLLPALSLDTVAAGTSPFAACLGQQVASPLLTVADVGRLPGMLGSHAITGEGLPTGTTTLLDQGRLSGFLADTYHAHKLAARIGVLPPRNGMRFATNDRSFGMRPGIFPTNVTLTSHEAEPLEMLLAPLTDGVYVGGLWYTYPQGGLQTGEFTSRVIGPSFHIQQGKLARPLQPGTLRLHDNVLDLLQRITGVSTTKQAVVLATMRSLVLAPDVRCSHARFVA
jgi:predicted Zn-dependent protease